MDADRIRLAQLTNVTHEGQQKASVRYDPNGNVIHHEEHEDHEASVRYDPNGNVIHHEEHEDHEGYEVSFGYDEMNRLTASTQSVASVQSVVKILMTSTATAPTSSIPEACP